MKRFRDLMVFGDAEALEALIVELQSRLTDGWYSDQGQDAILRSASCERMFWFRCHANAERPEAALVMWLDDRHLTVTNIVPHEQGRITVGQYNSILLEFHLRFLAQAAMEAGLPVELSSDERTIEEAFDPTAIQLLWRFSICANKSSRHPADDGRWQDLLIHIHLDGRRHSEFDPGLIANWLSEDGWPAEKVRELMSEYEFARDLMSELARRGLLAQSGERNYSHPAE